MTLVGRQRAWQVRPVFKPPTIDLAVTQPRLDTTYPLIVHKGICRFLQRLLEGGHMGFPRSIVADALTNE
jgi:hypothetical protein